jgi:hypothetical protein
VFHSTSAFHYDLGRVIVEQDTLPTTKSSVPDVVVPAPLTLAGVPAKPELDVPVPEPTIPVIELDELLAPPAAVAPTITADGDADGEAEAEGLDAQQPPGRRAFGAIAGLDSFADAALAARQADIARRVTGNGHPALEYEARKLVCEATVYMRSSTKLLSGLTHRRLLLFEGASRGAPHRRRVLTQYVVLGVLRLDVFRYIVERCGELRSVPPSSAASNTHTAHVGCRARTCGHIGSSRIRNVSE